MEKIKSLHSLIEEVIQQSGMENPESWTQANYVHLSGQIFKKTNVSINARTINRVINQTYLAGEDYKPKKGTLDALAIYCGYEGWFQYTNKNTEPNAATRHIPLKPILGIALGIIVISFFSFYLISINKPSRTSNLIFDKRDYKVDVLGMKDIYFKNTDLSKGNHKVTIEESYWVNKEWGGLKEIEIHKGIDHISQRFKEPGKYHFKLLKDDKEIDQMNFFVLNHEWQQVTLIPNQTSYYSPIVPKNGILTTPDSINKREHNTGQPISKTLYTYMEELPVDLDEVKFNTKVRNFYYDADGCNMFKIMLWGKNKSVILTFADSSCYDKNSIFISEYLLQGQTQDVGGLKRSYEDWTKIELSIAGLYAKLKLNDKTVFESSYPHKLGQLMGVKYWFLEGGAVDYVRFYNEQNSLLYGEEFE